MIQHNTTQPKATEDYHESCQVDDKPEPRVRVRSGEGTLAYWRSRLFRNSYRDNAGATVEIPEYYVRLRHGGVTKRVRLHTSDKEKAAEEALGLSARLLREGWGAVDAGRARLPASPGIDEFCEAYRKAAASMEAPPRPISVVTYTRSLRQLCALSGVKRLRELDRDAIERSRDAYRMAGRLHGRAEDAIQNTWAKIVRNAAACFSTEALSILGRRGLEIENPLAGVRRPQKIEPVSSLGSETTERIWHDLHLLRDGDPDATIPDRTVISREYRKKHGGRKARWLPVDFRLPHPDAYCAVLLALGTGLRANEIDKARWSWLKFDEKGECFLEVHEEDDFKPKGGTMRLLRIPRELRDELVKTRTDTASPYILGGQASRSVEKVGWGYRRRETIRIANAWLRDRGVEADELRGNPLHRLRKQFGSAVATEFGLFAAQKLLGHSSPTVTAKYYAAQTELPTLTHVKIVG